MRVPVKAATKNANREIREDRLRHQTNEMRKKQRNEAIALKRSVGGSNTVPFLTCVFALNESIDPLSALTLQLNESRFLPWYKTFLLSFFYVGNFSGRCLGKS